MTPVPLILDQRFDNQLPYADIPVVVPKAIRNHADVKREARVRSLLSAVNTITVVASALTHENSSKQGATKEELQEVQQQMLQEKLLKDELITKNVDLVQ